MMQADRRTGSAIVAASREFAKDDSRRSWWYVLSTLLLVVGLMVIAGLALPWPLRLAASVMAGLVMARGFIAYHDYMHGAILRKSRLARVLMHGYGLFALTPASSWRQSHNHHHANVGKLKESSIGSFPMMTTEMWREASAWQRLHYRLARHPLNLLVAYVTIFLLTMTVGPLLRKPSKHWDSAVALLLHGGLWALVWWASGPLTVLFVVALPFTISGALGAYLFYAQHNYPGMHVLPQAEWTFYRAALESCSYLRLGRFMGWITGQIGYHHVHHINSMIPFYRLADAMRAIPELQNPVVTTLQPRDIVACLRLKLWDERQGRMVGYAEA